ncbi:MAG: DUF86 domain-containing protein [Nitrospiraceae bacterium]|nr:DUF86 domain-containing protein [Nitrospiraceae bacterium]MDA8431849.1 DUF86 domain-containing protein [Nitrospiraceae bacterium]
MPDKDVVLAKVAAIQRCLRRIKDVTGLEPGRLDDIDAQDIFVLNLQRAIQAAIDLAAHVVASEGLGIADTVKGNFQLLQDNRIIPKGLSAKMQAMAGFRNIAIHDYQNLNVAIMKAILGKHLKDLEDFYTAVLTRFGMAEATKPRRPRQRQK